MKFQPFSISFSISSENEIVLAFQKALAGLAEQGIHKILSKQFVQDLLIAFTEGVANAIKHAKELQRKGRVNCQLSVNTKGVEIRIEDSGRGFSIRSVPLPRFKGYSDRGRGIFMMKQLMDSVEYRRLKKKNRLIMKRAFIGADKETRDLDLLYELSDAILQSSDLDSVYRVILDKAIEVFGVEKASILMYDPHIKKLRVVASRGLKHDIRKRTEVQPGDGISGYVFQHAKPCLIEDIDTNPSGWKKKKRYKSRSFISAPMICSPMRIGQETLGVINMTDRVNGKPFSRKDLRLLTTIANQATAYLHICQLISKVKDTEVLTRELDIARKIQQSYLPLKPPKLQGFDLAGWLETAQSVGGDYYDFIVQNQHGFYVVVADVSGHHVAAAMTMANFRSQLKALLFKESDPGQILTLLNESLFEDLARNDQFISMVLVRFHINSLLIEVANAGHRNPFLIRHSHVDELPDRNRTGAVIGSIQKEEYQTMQYSLQPSDALILYTDGVTEAINNQGDRFGMDRLIKVLHKYSSFDATELMQSLKKEVDIFRGEGPVSDDVTAVAVRITSS